jgi:hypothetical protein
MAGLKLTITSGNAAFADGNAPAEMARILCDLAERIKNYGSLDLQWIVRDINGNKVGLCYATEGDDDNDI